MADTTVRQTYVDHLKPLLPKRWRIVKYQTNLDRLVNVVVMLKQQSFEHLPEAPDELLRCETTVTVVSPKEDIAKAEDDLDDAVLELLHALDDLDKLTWTRAEKVLFQDKYLAYDISTAIHTRKDA